MTNAQHTPGPWKAFSSGKDFSIQTADSSPSDPSYSDDDSSIAAIHTGTDVDKANADLISAAPELKALIEKAVNVLATYIVPDSGITDQQVINTLLGIFDGPEYRAAILKATGKAA